MKKDKSYKKGHFTAIGLAIGIPLGIPLGLALGNIALGLALGLPIGFGIGNYMEKKYNKNPILPTLKEKRKQKYLTLTGLIIGLVLLAIFVAIYFWNRG